MTKYLDLSLIEINDYLKAKKIKPIDLVNEAFDRIEENKDLNCIITKNREEAVKRALELENKEVDNILFGIPIVIKDNIVTKDLKTTCASKMLDNFIPVYNATVVDKLNNKNMIIIGKTNMDEFAMGSSNQTSYYGPVLNPWDKDKAPGGSSGGSACAVSSRIVPFALGSDTGGSIRQPASFTGIVGLKPTYGRVSRSGLVAFASSLDQIGPMSRNVLENALLLNAIVGYDEKDMTSSKREAEDFTRLIGEDVKGMKIAIPNYYMSDALNKEIKDCIISIIDKLKNKGVIFEYVDIDYIEHSVPLYQIIALAEASSNLARFDGVRYGYRAEEYTNLDEMYKNTRALGFGDEVKRRIMIGSYVLSGPNVKTYYNKALKIRKAISNSFDNLLSKYDLIIGATTTTTAFNLGEYKDDAVKSFYDDLFTIPVNMAGLPGMSLPIGFDSSGMPIGMQIIGSKFDEAKIYKLAAYIENELNLDLNPKGVR
ncbi:MAG TPA: Asp-tRNA(Asn)/Glu-tRNA(Gln) amidotransferase subunit GatA [Mollicutes bacterium]|jgi:aspartyl-tRNA(Asn)/glutamyl-tRNA(Gln) amidotransferase subunit A|nr:Asp-tRNA(Asn)/Glu-tRNA(Gln) amidotransferase subunit GatA [Mollicutes bacterium]